MKKKIKNNGFRSNIMYLPVDTGVVQLKVVLHWKDGGNSEFQ